MRDWLGAMYSDVRPNSGDANAGILKGAVESISRILVVHQVFSSGCNTSSCCTSFIMTPHYSFQAQTPCQDNTFAV